jgi:hypothetical protein
MHGYLAWTQFVVKLYDRIESKTHHLGRLTKLKKFGTMEDFITTFEHLDFRPEGMSDAFLREFFISGLKYEICAHVLMERHQTWLEETQ